MKIDGELKVLRRLLSAQLDGKLHWGAEDPVTGWRCAKIGNEKFNTVSYRFRYIEAEPQIGADPYILELSMPGLNVGYFIGTQGYELLFQLHCESTGSKFDDDVSGASQFLDRNGL